MTQNLPLARLVKAFHIFFFLLMTVLLLAFSYEMLVGRVTAWSWATVGFFVLEGVILMLYKWECPLTKLAESLGLENGEVTYLFFPKWFSDRVFHIYGVVFGLCCLVLLYRQFV